MKFKPHHVALTVNNMEETVEWYKNNLGFKVTHDYGKYGAKKILLQLDEVRLELFDFDKENQPLPDYRKDLMEDIHVVGTKHLCIEVEDLDVLVQDLKQKGIETRKIDTAGFGGRFTFIKDNNGILIEFYQK